MLVSDRNRYLASAINEVYGQGWGFVLPVMGIYCLAWLGRIDIQSLRPALLCLQITIFLGGIVYLVRSFLTATVEAKIFMLVVVALCFLPGAYLEYPSDPWEHYRRIFLWNSVSLVSSHDTPDKFAYFWGWSFLGYVPIRFHKLALDLYSGFWISLVAYQLFLFSKEFGMSTRWAFTQVIAFIFLTGISVFNVRYYALSSTPLAYIAYLRGLRFFVSGARFRVHTLSVLLLLLGVIGLNHRQEFGFLLVNALGLTVLRHWKPAWKWPLIAGVIIASISGPVLIWASRQIPLAHFLGGIKLDGLSSVANFNLFRHRHPYLESLAIPGGLSLLATLFVLRNKPREALLTWLPFVVLLFPPSAIILRQFCSEPSDSYRILYSIPNGFGLVVALSSLTVGSSSVVGWLVSLLLVVFLSFPASFPFRGKARFHFYHPPAERRLEPVVRAAEWFSKQPNLQSCWIISSDAAVFGISAATGKRFSGYGHRLNPSAYARNLNRARGLFLVMDYKPFCGFLTPQLETIPRSEPSWVAEYSKHWSDDLGNFLSGFSTEYVDVVKHCLPKWGWKKTSVPPYFDFYSPPSTGPWAVDTMDLLCNFR